MVVRVGSCSLLAVLDHRSISFEYIECPFSTTAISVAVHSTVLETVFAVVGDRSHHRHRDDDPVHAKLGVHGRIHVRRQRLQRSMPSRARRQPQKVACVQALFAVYAASCFLVLNVRKTLPRTAVCLLLHARCALSGVHVHAWLVHTCALYPR